MSRGTVVVVGGGEPIDPAHLPALPEGGYVVAVDSGVDHALALGLHVDVAVGDFDSVSASGLAQVESAGAEVVRFPADKDATDLALALEVARAGDPERIVVIGARGGRLDHEVANLMLLAAPELSACDVVAHLGPATVHVARPGRDVAIDGVPGALVSLVPVGGPASGVTTEGLRYALADAVLSPTSSLGISNELIGRASVRVGAGVVLVIVPGAA